MRFYPDEIPCFRHEPTKDRFSIRRFHNGFGEGVVALEDIDPGGIVFAFTGFLVPEITQFSLEIREGAHVHDPYFMGKILHSCEPNTYCDMQKLQFIAVREIHAGDCVTMDYEQTESRLFKPFECHCNAPNCRKQIVGWAARNEMVDELVVTP